MLFGVLVAVGVVVLVMVGLLWGYLRAEDALKARRRIPMGAVGWVRGTVRLITQGNSLEVIVNRSASGHLKGRVGGAILGGPVSGALSETELSGRCGVGLQVSLADGRGKIDGQKVALLHEGDRIVAGAGELQVGEGTLEGWLNGQYGEVRVHLKYAGIPPLAVAAIAVAAARQVENHVYKPR